MIGTFFASSSSRGACTHLSFQNECFVVTTATGKHPLFASVEIAEQVVFAYKILRTKRFYVEARERQLIQLFKAVERKTFRLAKTHPGIDVETLIMIVSDRGWWIGKIGLYKLFRSIGKKLVPINFHTSVLDDYSLSRTSGNFESLQQLLACTPDVTRALNHDSLVNALVEKFPAQAIVDAAVARRKSGEYVAFVLTTQ